MKDALIIIDVQNDYFPGGTCELHKPYEAEERIKELIEESRSVGRKIVYIQHINPPDDYFFLEGTKGVEISERIKPSEEDKIIIRDIKFQVGSVTEQRVQNIAIKIDKIKHYLKLNKMKKTIIIKIKFYINNINIF